MPAPVDHSICQAPVASKHICGRTVIAVIRPSGRRKLIRYACVSHIVYYLGVLRNYTQINRLTITFIDEPSYREAEPRITLREAS